MSQNAGGDHGQPHQNIRDHFLSKPGCSPSVPGCNTGNEAATSLGLDKAQPQTGTATRQRVQTCVCPLRLYEVLNQNPRATFPQTFGAVQRWKQPQSLQFAPSIQLQFQPVVHEAISWLAWRNNHNRRSQLALSSSRGTKAVSSGLPCCQC